MKLKTGDPAPPFSLESVNQGKVSLEDYSGKKTLLVFSRYFGCPVCLHDWDALIALMKETGIEVIYFTQSSPETTKKYLEERPVDFPVIPVPEENGRYRVYDDYGVGNFGLGTGVKLLMRAREAKKAGKVHGEYEGKETQSPADFIVDEEGRILRANVSLFEADEIMATLSSLSK
ncbi:AhpC/TSA family protein [Candidatus Bathyarchaeota archaeon]|nr:AhpC/TSA family protein [Candidatus Bathyarchaeota archaeon]MBL7168885.1 AhpC/TSA family protein [Candidatus Bathyarchaeota archaeon]